MPSASGVGWRHEHGGAALLSGQTGGGARRGFACACPQHPSPAAARGRAARRRAAAATDRAAGAGLQPSAIRVAITPLAGGAFQGSVPVDPARDGPGDHRNGGVPRSGRGVGGGPVHRPPESARPPPEVRTASDTSALLLSRHRRRNGPSSGAVSARRRLAPSRCAVAPPCRLARLQGVRANAGADASRSPHPGRSRPRAGPPGLPPSATPPGAPIARRRCGCARSPVRCARSTN